jgi:hypothetical protein
MVTCTDVETGLPVVASEHGHLRCPSCGAACTARSGDLVAARLVAEVVKVASAMRPAQRAYFKHKTQACLREAKHWERRLDAALERLEMSRTLFSLPSLLPELGDEVPPLAPPGLAGPEGSIATDRWEDDGGKPSF